MNNIKRITRLGRLGLGIVLLCYSSLNSAASPAEDIAPAPLGDIVNFHEVSDQLLSSGQVLPQHIDAISDAGVKLVINLAPASEKRNLTEGFLVTEKGISYLQIPVVWSKPTDQDLSLFFAMMNAREERKTLVHCYANYRASAFTYLYRVLEMGVPEIEARQDLHKVWDQDAFDESPQWRKFIDRHLAGGAFNKAGGAFNKAGGALNNAGGA